MPEEGLVFALDDRKVILVAFIFCAVGLIYFAIRFFVTMASSGNEPYLGQEILLLSILGIGVILAGFGLLIERRLEFYDDFAECLWVEE